MNQEKTLREFCKIFDIDYDSLDKNMDLKSMAGMFSEYSDGKTDSVELVRRIRNEMRRTKL